MFFRLLQNRVQATHLSLEGDDLGWGAPGLGGDLGWGGEATRDAQECGGGPPPLGLLERDIINAMMVIDGEAISSNLSIVRFGSKDFVPGTSYGRTRPS